MTRNITQRILDYMTFDNRKPIKSSTIASETGIPHAKVCKRLSMYKGKFFDKTLYKGHVHWFKIANNEHPYPSWTPKREKLLLLLNLCSRPKQKFRLIELTRMSETSLHRYLNYLRALQLIRLDYDSYITIKNELPPELDQFTYTKTEVINGNI